MEEKKKVPWYATWWGIIAIIVFFYFSIPYFVWTKTNWHKGIKIGITVVCLGFFLYMYAVPQVVKQKEQQQEVDQLQSNKSTAIELHRKAELAITENKLEEAESLIKEARKMDSTNKDVEILEAELSNYNSGEFLDFCLINMTEEEYESLNKKKLTKVFITNTVLNTLMFEKLFENREKRVTLLAQKAEKEKEEQAKKRQESIQRQFSAWGGSHIIVTRTIKDSMNDPSSYQHVETKYWDMKDHLIVNTTFRGKNAFGAIILTTVKAKVSLDGKEVELLEQY
jgi:hypothetical protein